MGGVTTWKPVNLGEQRARQEAIAFGRRVMARSGDCHLRHDLEWALCGGAARPGVLAFCLDHDNGLSGFAVLLRQERPLRFQLGELTYYRQPLTRFDLWSAPLIAGVPEESPAWRDLAIFFLETMKSHLGPSSEAIGIEGLPTGSRFYRLLNHDPQIAKDFLLVKQGEPFLHQFIEMPETFDSYLKTLGKRSRQSLNNRRNRLFRDFAGDVHVTCFADDDKVSLFLDDAIAVSKKTYQWRLLGLGLRDRKALQDRLRFAASKRWLRSYLLYCAGQPVAFMLGYQYEDRFYYTDVGYDPDYSRHAVGSVLQLEVIADLYAKDHRPKIFDFSTGYGDHKAHFSNATQEEANLLLLPRSFRHAILSGAYRQLDCVANLATRIADQIGAKQRLKKTIRRFTTSHPSGETR
jgi:hypothetical protein